MFILRKDGYITLILTSNNVISIVVCVILHFYVLSNHYLWNNLDWILSLIIRMFNYTVHLNLIERM